MRRHFPDDDFLQDVASALACAFFAALLIAGAVLLAGLR